LLPLFVWPFTVPAVTALFTVEKPTFHTLASIGTSALEVIFKVVENAAKPRDKPTIATNNVAIAITFPLLSLSIFSPPSLKYIAHVSLYF
jgi:hypothetical protein